MTASLVFKGFTKIARLSRECVITEKIDGTNAQVYIRTAEDDDFLPGTDTQIGDLRLRAGSKERWLPHDDPKQDNFGFARWVYDNAFDLVRLGLGRHFGEWWGRGINRNYGLAERRFSLFNTSRWADEVVRPFCCDVVPKLYQGLFITNEVTIALDHLAQHGSKAAPGFGNPEGIVIYHTAANMMFKKTLVGDGEGKHQKNRPTIQRRPRQGDRRKDELPYPGMDRRVARPSQ